MLGLGGCKNVFVIRDIYSYACHAFPVRSRTTDEIIECVKLFAGDKVLKIHKLYSDNATEIVAALRHFHILAQHPQPGQSKANGVAERANREVIAMSRTVLEAAGLPACFWTYAAPYVTLMENVQEKGPRGSRYASACGGEFEADLIPFGAKVLFHPNERQGVWSTKMAPRAVSGVSRDIR